MTLKKVAKELRNRDSKRVVLVGGVFDLFHVGHLRYLRLASQQGDILVVHVDGDRRVRWRKGNSRPIIKCADRIEIINSLSFVDYVITSDDYYDSPRIRKLINPNVVVRSKRNKNLNEFDQGNHRVVILDEQSEVHTSGLVHKICSNYPT